MAPGEDQDVSKLNRQMIPDRGKVLGPWRGIYDTDEETADLTPSKLSRMLSSFAHGELDVGLGLMERIESNDLFFRQIMAKRRTGVTRLPWEIRPASDYEAGVGGEEQATYCQKALLQVECWDAENCLGGFPEVLKHLSTAVGRNVAVAELVWEGRGYDYNLVRIDKVPSRALWYDAAREQWGLRIRSKYDQYGILAGASPNKWVVYMPQQATTPTFRDGLMVGSMRMYLMKWVPVRYWINYSEIFGMPVRTATYPEGSSDEVKFGILKMLQQMAVSACGVFPAGSEVTFLEASRRSDSPYSPIIEWVDRQFVIGWLGQELTTTTAKGSGTLAGEVQKTEFENILTDDAEIEARMVRNQILAPLVRLKFGPKAPVPYFVRLPGEIKDRVKFANLLAICVNQLGMKIDKDWAHDQLGVREAQDGAEPLEGQPKPQPSAVSPDGMPLGPPSKVPVNPPKNPKTPGQDAARKKVQEGVKSNGP